jgi:hypothetical protein
MKKHVPSFLASLTPLVGICIKGFSFVTLTVIEGLEEEILRHVWDERISAMTRRA